MTDRAPVGSPGETIPLLVSAAPIVPVPRRVPPGLIVVGEAVEPLTTSVPPLITVGPL